MGKRQDTSTEDDNTGIAGTTALTDHSPPKKHKKHKHKKHKKKRIQVEESDDTQDINVVDDASALKIKLKLAKDAVGPSTSGDKIKDSLKESLPKPVDKVVSTSSSPKIASTTATSSKKKRNRGKDSGTSSEEERWLDAIESGKLEEVDDELKKIKPKDPKLMTARQRAMFERKSDKEPSFAGEQLVALPSGYKEKVMTVEALQKAALKSQKRKQQADEKREKDKKKTMERLLRKQDSKSGKNNKSRTTRKAFPRVTYRSNADGISISLPPGVDFPLATNAAPPATAGIKAGVCGVAGCTNARKYACSATGLALCSLQCYRINAKLASRLTAS